LALLQESRLRGKGREDETKAEQSRLFEQRLSVAHLQADQAHQDKSDFPAIEKQGMAPLAGRF